MKTFACVLFLAISFLAAAQRECATQPYAALKKTVGSAAAERFIDQQIHKVTYGIDGNTSITGDGRVIRIPVVVHVLYNTPAQNISDEQIKSGIAALNRDFRKQNKDTLKIPDMFKAAAADVQIEFQLATADPYGVATTGIVRKQTNATAFEMDDKIKFSNQGGDDAWDSKKYLNIWLGNTRRLLGYATMPGGDEKLDGMVINVSAFGTLKTSGPYNMGRTVVHETGHWLGLRHIWGNEPCGDDGVDDTPPQAGYTSGCPSTVRSSCTNDGDMYMNYMDFTNDACMNLFTHGQKERMRAAFASGGPRHSLLASTGLKEPWAEPIPVPKDSLQQEPFLDVYPNPAAQRVVLRFNVPVGNRLDGVLYLMNATGASVEKINITTAMQTVPLGNLRPGVYILQGIINNTKVMRKVVKL